MVIAYLIVKNEFGTLALSAIPMRAFLVNSLHQAITTIPNCDRIL